MSESATTDAARATSNDTESASSDAVNVTEQTFNSQIGVGLALDPLRPASTHATLRADRIGGTGNRAFVVENMLTSSGDNAFRIAVMKADQPSLLVFRGVPDQEYKVAASVSFKVPADAFVHTNPRAVITLRALMTDGRVLPKWLHFDPTSGRFEGKPPLNAPRVLSIMVVARDGDGREVSTIFRIKFGKEMRRDSGRSGLSEQLRIAAHRDDVFQRYPGK